MQNQSCARVEGRSDGEKVEVGGQEEGATVIQRRDNRDI